MVLRHIPRMPRKLIYTTFVFLTSLYLWHNYTSAHDRNTLPHLAQSSTRRPINSFLKEWLKTTTNKNSIINSNNNIIKTNNNNSSSNYSTMSPTRFDEMRKLASHEYLTPLNSFKTLNGRKIIDARTREAIHDIFRTGFGTTLFKTADGKNAWVENGVVFRPIRRELKLMVNYDNINYVHPSNYEYYVPFDENQFFEGKNRTRKENLTDKIILWYDRISYIQQMPSLERLKVCPDFPCRITTNRKYVKDSSAMIFEGTKLSSKPPSRRPEQVFIFHYEETPPLSTNDVPKALSSHSWRSAFNWTMSYRMGVDIPIVYGLVRKRPETLVKDYQAIIARKRNLTVAIMTHCHPRSQRDGYITDLRQYVPVDIYGKCGVNICNRGDDTDCIPKIISNYKFYLAFENALCDDYFTEKVFRYFNLDVILVVRGGEGYLHHLPPESYINTADFESPRHLEEHLLYLDQHSDEYEAMLRAKDKYVGLYETWVTFDTKGHISWVHFHYEAVPFCQICQWLWNLDSHAKTVPDINTWLFNTTCVEATDFNESLSTHRNPPRGFPWGILKWW